MAGLQFGLGFAKTIFLGLDFRKTETNLFLNFVRAEEGSGEESARAFRISFWRGGLNNLLGNVDKLF